jgi:hypothetical protein
MSSTVPKPPLRGLGLTATVPKHPFNVTLVYQTVVIATVLVSGRYIPRNGRGRSPQIKAQHGRRLDG